MCREFFHTKNSDKIRCVQGGRAVDQVVETQIASQDRPQSELRNFDILCRHRVLVKCCIFHVAEYLGSLFKGQ